MIATSVPWHQSTNPTIAMVDHDEAPFPIDPRLIRPMPIVEPPWLVSYESHLRMECHQDDTMQQSTTCAWLVSESWQARSECVKRSYAFVPNTMDPRHETMNLSWVAWPPARVLKPEDIHRSVVQSIEIISINESSPHEHPVGPKLDG